MPPIVVATFRPTPGTFSFATTGSPSNRRGHPISLWWFLLALSPIVPSLQLRSPLLVTSTWFRSVRVKPPVYLKKLEW